LEFNLTLFCNDPFFCFACLQTQRRGIQQSFAFLNQCSILDYRRSCTQLVLFQMYSSNIARKISSKRGQPTACQTGRLASRVTKFLPSSITVSGFKVILFTSVINQDILNTQCR